MSSGDRGVSKSAAVELSSVSVVQDGGAWIIQDPATGARLKTGEPGAEAVLLMRQGLPLDAVESMLARRFGYPRGAVDTTPLIRALQERRMIRERSEGSPSETASTRMARAIRWAPLPLMLRLLYRERHARNLRTIAAVRSHLSATLHAPPESIERLAGLNYVLLRQSYIDRLLLASLGATRLQRWLRRYTVVNGAGCLRARRGGVLLSGFHTGSYSMLPFILGAWGIRVVTLMNVTPGQEDSVRERMSSVARAGVDCGVRFVFGAAGLRAVARALKDGETALVLTDSIAEPRGRSHVVSIAARNMSFSASVEWLQGITGAQVFPLTLQSGSGPQHRVTIHPVAPAGEHFAERLYAPLNELLSREAHQWLRWKDLDRVLQQ